MLRTLGSASVAVGVGSLGIGSAGAKSTANSAEGPPIAIENITQLNSRETVETYLVKISERNAETGSRHIRTLLIEISNDGSVSAAEIDATTRNRLLADGDTSAMAITFGKEDLVERKKLVSVDTKPCNVYNNYTHEFHGVAIEYKQSVNNIGITTAAGVAAALIASLSSLLAALIAGVGGLFALISNTDSVTIGVVELDRWFYLDPAHLEVIAIGYNAAERGAFDGNYPTHPQPVGGHPYR